MFCFSHKYLTTLCILSNRRQILNLIPIFNLYVVCAVFLIPISLHPNVVHLRYFNLWILSDNIIKVKKFQWFATSECKDKRIWQFEFLSKTPLHNLLIWFLYTAVYILATYTTQQQITDIQIIGTFTLCTIHTITILIIHTLYHSYCNNNYGKQFVSATQLFIDTMNSTKKIFKKYC